MSINGLEIISFIMQVHGLKITKKLYSDQRNGASSMNFLKNLLDKQAPRHSTLWTKGYRMSLHDRTKALRQTKFFQNRRNCYGRKDREFAASSLAQLNPMLNCSQKKRIQSIIDRTL